MLMHILVIITVWWCSIVLNVLESLGITDKRIEMVFS